MKDLTASCRAIEPEIPRIPAQKALPNRQD